MLTASCYAGVMTWLVIGKKVVSKASHARELARIVRILNNERFMGCLPPAAFPASYTSLEIERANTEHLGSLRAMVNQWIDSGKDGDGHESPITRDLRAVPPGWTVPLLDVVMDWLRRNRPITVLYPDGKLACEMSEPERMSAWRADARLSPEDLAREVAVFVFQDLLNTPGSGRLACCNNS